MRKVHLILVLAAMLLSHSVAAGNAQQSPASLTGRWLANADFFGTPIYFQMELSEKDGKLTGTFSGDKLEGTRNGANVHFLAKDERGGTEECTATVQNGVLTGTVVFVDSEDPTRPETHKFAAQMIPQARSGPPQRHEFVPNVFHRQFASTNKPVLNIWPGDTVHTTTVDAGGTDEKGVTRVLGGNPETGPFYVETAAPGDMLAIHLNKVRLNRDWAVSDDAIVDRGLDSDLAVKMKDVGKTVRWHLDMQRGVATPEKPGEHMAKYAVPLKPMLGCVGVAPNSTQAPPPTGDSGRWGGNMDFNEVVEGATVYLPVNVPGALLYVGDGHATQGDGELNGNALETSMEVEFTVTLIPAKRIRGPRVESATHIMAMGLAGSLDDAFRSATANMAQWLEVDYKLTPSEVAQVLGTAAEYRISEVADRNAGIVLKINKERLATLSSKK